MDPFSHFCKYSDEDKEKAHCPFLTLVPFERGVGLAWGISHTFLIWVSKRRRITTFSHFSNFWEV